ncbi:hypothetical protein ACWF7H_25045, partial [Peribacillus butanolivorans]
MNERTPSRYGVIKEIKGTITALDLAILDANSKGIDKGTFTDNELEKYIKYLEKISNFPVN